jgi:GR25 family glycosyltransferase involved in LPS biosynthesis
MNDTVQTIRPKIHSFVINMDRDTQRLEIISQLFASQKIPFDRHVGTLIDSTILTLFGRRFRIRRVGNAGVAIAHLTLWKKISSMEEQGVVYNILEDDELIKDRYVENLQQVLSTLNEPFDFFNLNVLRPCGIPVAPEILKIQHKKLKRKLPNIWLSNYLITPQGAKKLIDQLFLKHKFNINTDFDRTLVRLLHKRQSSIAAFVLNETNKYSFHYEKTSSKKELNRSFFMDLYFTLKGMLRRFFPKR